MCHWAFNERMRKDGCPTLDDDPAIVDVEMGGATARETPLQRQGLSLIDGLAPTKRRRAHEEVSCG